MEKTKYSESKFYRDRIRQRKTASKAVAFLERGKWAGIPSKHLRVKKRTFRNLLYDKFYGSTEEAKKLVEDTYVHPENLFERPFVTIDGGNIVARKLAGYTLLFRIILCDKWVYHKQCSQLFSLFQAGFAKANERADTIEDLKRYDALFISEINQNIFDPRIMVGTYFDEILDARADQGKVTIVSFSNPISRQSKLGSDCGDYLSTLSSSEETNSNVLRIKVRKSDV